jgi:hypothetical protein
VLVSAVAFWQIVLAVHIAAVVVAFGVTFALPVIAGVGPRLDPRAAPLLHRLRQRIGRIVINPGLTLVLIAGIYLASDLHQWHKFYVQWGVAVAIVLGALEGSFMIRQAGKLAELAERDIAASGDGTVEWSAEYHARVKRTGAVGALMSGLVLVTVYLMTVQS